MILSGDAVNKFHSTLNLINLAAPDVTLNLHERISIMYEYTATGGKGCPLPGLNSINYIIFRRASSLKLIDPDGTMILDQLSKATRDSEDIEAFAKMMDTPAVF